MSHANFTISKELVFYNKLSKRIYAQRAIADSQIQKSLKVILSDKKVGLAQEIKNINFSQKSILDSQILIRVASHLKSKGVPDLRECLKPPTSENKNSCLKSSIKSDSDSSSKIVSSDRDVTESQGFPTRLSSILIVEDRQGRREIVLDSSVYSVGRDAKCDVRLASQFVSRHHATLVQLPRDDESYYYRVIDGNLKGKPSANGMLINGRKLKAHDLKNEDEIVFGPQARAIYYQLRRDDDEVLPPEEFDITLISPNMLDKEDWIDWSHNK